MELLEYKIEVTGKKRVALPWKETHIIPIADTQVGSEGFSEGQLREDVSRAIDFGNSYFVGLGDYIDIMSPSNRMAWRSARLYDSVHTAMSNEAEDCVGKWLRIMEPTKGKWLGILEGHHWYDFEDGTTSDTRIAQALGTTFLGTCAFIRLVFKGTTHTSMLGCTLWVHHGAGNGIMPYSPLTRLSNVMRQFDADIYIIGHQSKKPAVPVPYLYMSDKPPYTLIAKNKILAGAGCYSEGYHQGSKDPSGKRPQGSYVEQRLLNPVAIGGITVKIIPARTSKTDRLDLRVEI